VERARQELVRPRLVEAVPLHDDAECRRLAVEYAAALDAPELGADPGGWLARAAALERGDPAVVSAWETGYD